MEVAEKYNKCMPKLNMTMFSADGTIQSGTKVLSRCTHEGGYRNTQTRTKTQIIVFNLDKQGRARQGKADMDRNTRE